MASDSAGDDSGAGPIPAPAFTVLPFQVESTIVAGDESDLLKARVEGPGALEALLQEIRAAAQVSTRTTVVLSTPWESRGHVVTS